MKTKLRILTCVHGRHGSLQAFFWQIESLRKASGYELPVTLAYSDDEDYEFMQEQGFLTDNCQAVKAPNEPLSEKHNEALRAAMKITGKNKWTHLLHLGSDDLLGLDYLSYVALNPFDYAGVSSLFFFNPSVRKMAYYKYKNRTIIGAGRVMSRRVLKQTKAGQYEFRRPYHSYRIGDVAYVPDKRAEELIERSMIKPCSGGKKYALWLGNINRGLDMASNRVLKTITDVVDLTDQFEMPQLVDVKTEKNITPWDRVNAEVLPAREMKKVINHIAPDLELL